MGRVVHEFGSPFLRGLIHAPFELSVEGVRNRFRSSAPGGMRASRVYHLIYKDMTSSIAFRVFWKSILSS